MVGGREGGRRRESPPPWPTLASPRGWSQRPASGQQQQPLQCHLALAAERGVRAAHDREDWQEQE